MNMMNLADNFQIWIPTLLSKVLTCEWDLRPIDKAVLPFVVYFFMGIGSGITGKVADIFGRWLVFVVSFYFLIASVLSAAFAPTYQTYLAATSVIGYCVGATQAVCFCYMAEMVPKDHRPFHTLILNFMSMAGGLLACLTAYFVMDLASGWRVLMVISGLPCLATLILLYGCDESPRYLAISNRKDEAAAVLVKICKENNVTVPEGEMIATEEQRGTYADIYSPPYTRTSLLISLLFFCNLYINIGIMYLIPDMMSMGYCTLSEWFDPTKVTKLTYLSNKPCEVYTSNEYLFLLGVRLLYIPAMFIGSWTAKDFGRKASFLYSGWGSLIAIVFLMFCLEAEMLYTLVAAVVILYSLSTHVLFIYTPEYYPTYIRSTAMGVHLGIGRLGAAVAALVSEYLDTINIRFTIATYILVIVVNAVATCFLQTETRGQALVDNRVSPESYGAAGLESGRKKDETPLIDENSDIIEY